MKKIRRFSITWILLLLFFIGGFIGETWCIIRITQCNWQPIGKAEIVYTIAASTGTGCIVGYINIKDE
jgi:hypothetical protein